MFGGGGKRGVLSAVLSLGLAVSGFSGVALIASPGPAEAAPGTPGTPQPNTAVFQEGFENGTGNAPVLLTAYTGVGGQKYTADPGWLTGCNGQIVNFDTPYTSLGNCTSTSWTSMTRQLAWALGQHAGSATPQTNHAVTAFTENNPGANAIQIRTVGNIPLASSSGRYLTFSVDTAALNCSVSAPQYQFAFLNQAGVATNVGGLVNACSSGQTVTAPANGTSAARSVNVGTYTSNGSVLFNSPSLGIQMRNANGSGVGNDAAFDNIRILDVTPQLDKAFAPATVTPNQASTLRFTVTNTAELSAKNGWSFTDALPAGLRVASPNAVATTCPAGTVTAPAGATSITASGNLAAGMASCTVTVNVIGATAGTYTNGPDNVTTTGLDEPGTSTLTVAPPVVSCSTDAALFNTGYNATTGGTQPVGGVDPNWQISPQVLSTTLAAPAPAAGTTWSPATVSGRSSTLWIESPYGNAEWIANAAGTAGVNAAGQHNQTGYWYYRHQFTLDAAVDPAAFALAMDFYADNSVGDIWVNGASQGVSSGGNNPYYAGGFLAGGVASTTLDEGWVTGLNTIVVMVKSAPGAQGFLAQVRPSVLCPEPGITLEKTATPATASAAGDDITYSFEITNTGGLTLADVTVTEGDFSGTGTLSEVVCPAGAASLAPGASVTCTATYELTQADVDAGSVTNSATATGTPERGEPPVSAPSEATVDIPPASALTVVKSATPIDADEYAVGQQIDYSFVVTNTGNTTMTDVAVEEGTFTGTGELSEIVCPAGAASLAPGAQLTCTATYTLTQADVDSGSLSNSATATGTPPSGPPIESPPSEVTIPTPPAPGISVTKTASPLTTAAAGDEVDYSFLVTNTGNVTLTDVEVIEGDFSGTGSLSAIECPTSALIPGGQLTCTATYTLTQADLDAGELTNTATATGTPPSGTPPVSDPSTAILELPPAPALTVAKTATPATAGEVGDEITYSFLVTNTGNVTLADVTVAEGAFTGTGELTEIVCPAGAASLAPGDDVTCTATYTLTQADVDAGSVSNTATATGTPPGGGTPPESPPSTTIVEIPPAPAITLAKSATPATAGAAGDDITYSFLVTNTGNVTLSGVTVTEGEFSGTGELSAIECPAGAASLAPGASVTCTATYELTQTDADAGEVSNTATATGTPPTGTPPVSPPSTTVVEVPPAPGITVAKTADPATVGEVGDDITYSFLVTNTGNVTLTGVTVEEGEFTGTGELSAITCPDGAASLAPGASVTCTATYELTQADVDAGSVSNTATATGTPPGNTPPPDSPPSTVIVEVPPAPALTVVKSATPATAEEYVVGQEIAYSFVVTNTGNVTLADVTVEEAGFTGTGELSAIECPAGAASLAPGAQVTCSATYTLTQADVDAGSVTNSATATGTPPSGPPPVSPPSQVTIPTPPVPGITVEKSATPASAGEVGDEITYSFLVTNTGNVTLTDVRVVEGEFTGTGDLSAIECPADVSLLPGERITCTATYVLTQADVDAGSVSNTATATGTPPSGTPPVSPPSEVTIDIPPAPALTVDKTATPTTAGEVGDVITYSFLVTNTGNVTLADVSIVEGAFTGTGELSPVECPAAAASLAPGATVTCVATYTLTQADVDAGSITNSATATGTPPGNTPPPVSPPDEVTIEIPPAPAVTVVKSASPATAEEFVAGQEIVYSFVVTNTGNVTLADVAVDDAEFTGSGDLSPIVCPEAAASLAPGAQVTCTATYVLTQADVDAGSVSNSATATGTPPSGTPPVSPPSEVTIPTPAAPGIELVKTSDAEALTEVGQIIQYAFEVTNTGNVTLSDIAVDETAFSGSGELSDIACPADPLLPGQTVTCTASYEVTQADVDAGELTNTATASGLSPDGQTRTVSAQSTRELPFVGATALELVKRSTVIDVNGNELTDPGDRIRWSFTVTNIGLTTVTDIGVNDPTGGPVTCPATILPPGGSMDCTTVEDRTITAADVRTGQVANTATATGTGPNGTVITSNEATATVTVVATPVQPLAITGGTLAAGALVTALGGLVAGALLLILGRRRTA